MDSDHPDADVSALVTPDQGQKWEWAVAESSGSSRALLLANRSSGLGGTRLDGVLDVLQQAGIVVLSVAPNTPAQIPELIRNIAPKTDMIIIGGGDGTLSCCLPALMETDRPFGVLPMGTANDLARTLGLPSDPVDAAAVISRGVTKKIDIGIVNDRPFFNVASIGFPAEVARFHTGWRKKLLRLVSYPISWFDALKVHRNFNATITCDGHERRVRCSMIAVGNGRHYGGGLTISEDADIDDGWLRVSYVRPVRFWRALGLLPSLRLGTIAREEEAEVWRAKRIAIRTDRSKRINVDGELVGTTPANFAVREKCLEVFVPSAARGPNDARND